MRNYDPERPQVVGVDIFVPADADPFVIGRTMRITHADSAVIRGTVRVSGGPAGADTAYAPAFEIEGVFAASCKQNCG